MRVSVVIPAYNEAGNIARLVAEVGTVVPAALLGEIIVVDDASDDASLTELRALGEPRLRILCHGRRAGQSAALRSGVRAAACPVIVTLDGDGQNDPADIPALLRRLAGSDGGAPGLVGGIRQNRRAAGSRRLASRLANGLRGSLLKDECPDTGCGIKAFRRAAFLELPYFATMHRYLPALFLSYGHKVAYVPVNDRPRLAGRSKYTNLGRALVGLHDLFGVVWLRRRTVLPPVSEDGVAMARLTPSRLVEPASEAPLAHEGGLAASAAS